MRAAEFINEVSLFGRQKFDTQIALAKLKADLQKQKTAQTIPQGDVAVAQEPEPVQSLADLQKRRNTLDPIVKTKQEIEKIVDQLTKGGRELPPGLAADIADYYSVADAEKYPEEVLRKYQKQLDQLKKYQAFKRAAWR